MKLKTLQLKIVAMCASKEHSKHGNSHGNYTLNMVKRLNWAA